MVNAFHTNATDAVHHKEIGKITNKLSGKAKNSLLGKNDGKNNPTIALNVFLF